MGGRLLECPIFPRCPGTPIFSNVPFSQMSGYPRIFQCPIGFKYQRRSGIFDYPVPFFSNKNVFLESPTTPEFFKCPVFCSFQILTVFQNFRPPPERVFENCDQFFPNPIRGFCMISNKKIEVAI